MPGNLAAVVAIKLGDKVTTDHIIPAGSAGRFRSNIRRSSEFVFKNVDPEFPARCEAVKARGMSPVIVAGQSYGQGSSREHAAICPMFLGVRAVIARSVERIHLANLINFGIMPLIFKDPADYDRIPGRRRARDRRHGHSAPPLRGDGDPPHARGTLHGAAHAHLPAGRDRAVRGALELCGGEVEHGYRSDAGCWI